MMGTRPAATSMVTSITCSHSSCVSVGVSPVVPQGTRKSIPDSICHATRLRSAVSSISAVGSERRHQRSTTSSELHGFRITPNERRCICVIDAGPKETSADQRELCRVIGTDQYIIPAGEGARATLTVRAKCCGNRRSRICRPAIRRRGLRLRRIRGEIWRRGRDRCGRSGS